MPLRFTLRQLEYFIAVGELGSIALASEKVNVSSPSISAAISQLEKEFGLSLFVRKHAHGLTLTHAGAQMMDQAIRLLKEAGELNNMASDISGTVRGPLNVGCLLSFAQLIVPNLRRQFVEKHPDIQFSQFELHQLEIFDRLRKAELDIAISYDIDIPSDLHFTPLLELSPYALVNEKHPLADRQSVTIDELKEHPMVLLDLPHSAGYFTSLFSQSGAKPNIAERTRDMAVMRSLVANGFGYSIANIRPRHDFAPDGKKLKFIPLTGNIRALKLGLVTAEGVGQMLSVSAFVEHCREQLTEDSLPGMMITKTQSRDS